MIYEALLEGRENTRTGRELCELFNVTARTLTVEIERERRGGKPICAAYGTNPGYFIAANKEEMRLFCRQLKHRAGEIGKTRAACIRAMRKLPERQGVLNYGNKDQSKGKDKGKRSQ